MENSISHDTAATIRETANLINFAGAWGLNEFLVFFFLSIMIAFFIIFFIMSRQGAKNTEILVEVVSRNADALNNQAGAMREIIAKYEQDNTRTYAKLEGIHDDVKEIKFSHFPRRTRQPSFKEHIFNEENYEDAPNLQEKF